MGLSKLFKIKNVLYMLSIYTQILFNINYNILRQVRVVKK